MRAEAFLARALRRADKLDSEVSRKLMMTYDLKKRKEILKKHFLELDYGT